METKTISAALAKAQAKMGRALKDSQNPAFKSKYADLASVMDACLPALNEAGIAVIQPFYQDEFGRYVKTILVHESGETFECAVPLIVGKNDMQGLGSAITYARRYGLMSMAGIAPEDDDGNAAVASAARTITTAQYQELRMMIEDTASDEAKLLAFVGAANSEELTAAQWDKAMVALRRKPKAAPEKAPANADLAGDVIPY